MFGSFRWRYSELTEHVEAERLQRIADNQNQNFIQHHDMTPVLPEHQVTYGGDTTVCNYDPNYSGQSPNSVTGSHLFNEQMAQRAVGSSTAGHWQSPCNIYSDDPYSFAPYTSAPGLGLSDAHHADTPPITYAQPLNYEIHHQVQSPGGPYFGQEFEPDVHSADSPPITQPAHYDIHHRLEPRFGPEADAHLADSTSITHHQIQLAEAGSPFTPPRQYTCMWHGCQLCGQITAEGVARHMATFHFIRGETHYVCQWKGCQRSKPYRRDTICRHIREVHLGERRQYS